MNPLDQGNPWAVFDNYIDRVATQCVNALAPKWATRLAAFDVYAWDQCFRHGAKSAHRLTAGGARSETRPRLRLSLGAKG
jgi:hypothetical protein